MRCAHVPVYGETLCRTQLSATTISCGRCRIETLCTCSAFRRLNDLLMSPRLHSYGMRVTKSQDCMSAERPRLPCARTPPSAAIISVHAALFARCPNSARPRPPAVGPPASGPTQETPQSAACVFRSSSSSSSNSSSSSSNTDSSNTDAAVGRQGRPCSRLYLSWCALACAVRAR